MKCFSCGGDIPGKVAFESNEGSDKQRAMFRCPLCDVSILRELIEFKPDGTPVYQFRLWGHPATTRRRFKSPGAPPKSPTSTAV
jgi:hypothetical protein